MNPPSSAGIPHRLKTAPAPREGTRPPGCRPGSLTRRPAHFRGNGKRPLARFTALAATLVPVASGGEIVVWPVNGHAYLRVDVGGITWSAARAAAAAQVHQGMTGHLVTVTSAEENRFLTEDPSLGADGANLLNRRWMGGYQLEGAAEPEEGWVWITGEPFVFANWSPFEPNDASPGEDHLLFNHLFSSDGKQWNDAPGNYSGALGYVIEFEPRTVSDRLRWSFQTGGQIMSCPAIGTDGTVYVGVVDGQVYALDGATGTPRWTFRATPKEANSPALSDDETVLYIGSYSRVYALDSSTGAVRWEFPTGGGGGSSPAIGENGIVYVCSCDGNVYALDGATGQKRWQFGMAGACNTASPAIGTDGTVYVGSGDGTVFAFEGATGQVRWKFPAGSRLWASPALGADGTVCVGSGDGQIAAIAETTGKLLWRFQTGRPVSSSPAIGPDGTVYVGSDDGKVYALVGSTGTWRWEFGTGREVMSSPAIAADGTVYVGSNDHRLYALEGGTGKMLWSSAAGGGVVSSPAIGPDGTVYVGSHDGNLYALRGGSGLANSPWPKFRGDARNSGRIAGAEPAQAPVVIAQPEDLTVVVGADVSFAVIASGTPLLVYEWRKDGLVLVGSTEASLVLNHVRLDQAGGYSVVITNSLGAVTSRVATLTVRLPEDAVVWPVNGHAYRRVDSGRIAWADARAAAEAAGYEGKPGHLVTVNSAEENRFLTEHALLGNDAAGRLDGYWLGAYQPSGSFEPAGGWGWVTGEPFAFANWAPGEPNNMSGLENALVFWAPSNAHGRLWNDAYELTTYTGEGVGYVIEYEPAPAPDTIPPVLVEVAGDATLTRVTLKFSEALAAPMAANLTNYALSGGLQVLGAMLGADGTAVVLTTGTQTPTTVYTVTVNHVTDLAGNRIAADSQGSFTPGAAAALGQFMFANKNTLATPPIDARAFDSVGGSPLAGTAYWAQAYVKLPTDPDSDYLPVGAPVNFRTGANAGYIVPVVVTTRFPAGTTIVVEMRVWEASRGGTYEEALANGGLSGRSNPVSLTVTAAPNLPADMVGLQSWYPLEPPPMPPWITRQPSGVRVAVDQPFVLSVSAANAAPWAYQWYREGQPVLGQYESVLSVLRAQLSDAGGYHVTVTNYVGGVTSQVAQVVVGYPLTLTTNGPGRIEVEPAFEVYEPGQPVVLTAIPAGGLAFAGWAGDATGTVNPTTLTMDGPRQVEARFTSAPSRVKWQVAAGGAVSGCPAELPLSFRP